MKWDLIKIYIFYKLRGLFEKGIRTAWFDGRVWVSEVDDVYQGGWIVRVTAYHVEEKRWGLEDVADSYYPVTNKAKLDLLLTYRDIHVPEPFLSDPFCREVD